MSDEKIIEVDKVSKHFRLPLEKTTSLKAAAVNFYKRNKAFEMQKALSDISLDIKRGEFFGIIGRNGSGKSTLLKMLAGIYIPTGGTIKVNGSLTPFIELGVGFNHELTGRENVFLNGALLGFTRTEMGAMYNDIVEFAELEKFMDQKLKNYSSGMQVRLAFSIAIRAQSDILLIDEVLAVGDLSFQEKCYRYFEDMKKTGRTVVFISHDGGAIERFCDRVAIIDKGKLVDTGDPTAMVLEYGAIIAQEQMTKEAREGKKREQRIKGTLAIKDVLLLDRNGKETTSIEFGERFSLQIIYSLKKPIEENVVAGIDIIDAEREESILGPNTKESKVSVGLRASGTITAEFDQNPLSPKVYNITAGIFNQEETFAYDLAENIRQFKVIGKPRHGKIYIEPRWQLKEDK
jgi:ABC-2 type transport system ATP-binding protein